MNPSIHAERRCAAWWVIAAHFASLQAVRRRIAFISERRGGFLRCGARPNPTFTLYGMMPDGSDIIPLSSHETHRGALRLSALRPLSC